MSVIRLSGPDAFSIAYKIFLNHKKEKLKKNFEHSRFYYGWIADPKENNLIDEIILLSFEAPKSYTTENVIEIQCHGGYKVTQKILELCMTQGCRLAEKGEYTKRAFLGGRIDLTQVEAVLDIISAKTDLFSSVAAYNLSGQLSILINTSRTKLINIMAHISASTDFPDEVDSMPSEELKEKLSAISNNLNNILSSATDGNILKNGIKLGIIGKPNVGKSSLFNCLLNYNRSIVTEIPGTTRDILQESIEIDGIPLIVSDTAGIREIQHQSDSDRIETIGIDRSKNVIKESDLILFIYDINEGIIKDDKEILSEVDKKNIPILYVANKIDLTEKKSTPTNNHLEISAEKNIGIDELKLVIKNTVLGPNFKVEKNEVYINMRHQECIKKALKHIQLSLDAIAIEEVEDIISIDIKSALLSLDEIVGEVVAEEIVDNIFSQFCVGK